MWACNLNSLPTPLQPITLLTSVFIVYFYAILFSIKVFAWALKVWEPLNLVPHFIGEETGLTTCRGLPLIASLS